MITRKPSHTPPASVTGSSRRLTATGMDNDLRAALHTIQRSLLATDEPAHTLGEAIARFRGEHLLVGPNKPSTIAWRESTLRVLARWEHRPIAGRFRDVAAQLYQEARDRGLKEATPSLQVNTLSRVLNLAKSWGWRQDEHDLRGLCRVRAGRRTGIIVPEHLAAIGKGLAELDEKPRRHVAAECCRFVLFTGWRVSEGCEIERANIDAARSTVHLPDTKTGPQTRVIAALALDVLQRQPHVGPYVFPRRRDNGPIDRRQVLAALQDACEIGGVPRAAIHLVRHTFATVGAQLDLSPQFMADALGHTVEQQQTYVHPRVEDAKRVVDQVAQQMRKAVGT